GTRRRARQLPFTSTSPHVRTLCRRENRHRSSRSGLPKSDDWCILYSVTTPRRSATADCVGDSGKPLRAVLYARVSTRDKQDPESQLGALRQWAAARGWAIVGGERDRISGAPAKRRGAPAGLARAFRTLEERRADVLAVFAADRLVRSATGLLHLVERVQAI